MAKYSFRRVSIEVGVEPSRGGGPADTAIKFLLANSSFSFSPKAMKVKKSASLGDIAMNRGDLLEDQYAAGSFEGELRDKSFGLLLLNAIGTLSSAVNETTAYDHTLTLEQSNQIDSIYIKVYDPNKAILFRNVNLSKLTIKIAPGDVVKVSCDWVGKKDVVTVNSVISRITENNFTKNHAFIKVAANTAGLTAATRLSVKEFELTFDKGNIEHDSSLGTAEPEDFHNPDGYRIMGKLKLNYEDETFLNYMKLNTMRALRLDLLNSDVTIGATSNPEFKVDFTDVYFEEWEPDNDLAAIRKQDIPFECHFDESNRRFWDSMVLTNEQSAYA